MSEYTKQYKACGRTYGIEDLEDGKKNHWNLGKKKGQQGYSRFLLWAGGCGVGRAKTLQQAKIDMQAHIVKDLQRGKKTHSAALIEINSALAAIERGPIDPLEVSA